MSKTLKLPAKATAGRALAPEGRRPPARPVVQPAGESIRLNKRLADLGHCSRREADDWVARGWVRVNGEVAQMGQPVRLTDRIEVAPEASAQQGERVTILLHKPVGYVSGLPEDGHESAAVLVQPRTRWKDDRAPRRFAAAHTRGLAPAGRLDIDSTGLLVLTQDGRIARHLIGEDSDVEKEYLVRVEPMSEGSFNPDDIERLRHGLELDGKQLKPAKVSWANEDQLRFVLREGRKRQVRRM
jgi:23S rRNA pseudouridine2604 synthase